MSAIDFQALWAEEKAKLKRLKLKQKRKKKSKLNLCDFQLTTNLYYINDYLPEVEQKKLCHQINSGSRGWVQLSKRRLQNW